ncbi:MAG: amidohydrolase family protein [Cyclobacteriaceae bacterium]
MDFLKTLFLSSLLLIISCDPPPEDVEEIIFQNVNVIPMTSEQVLEDQSVVIRGDSIFKIAPVAEIQAGAKSTVVDGTGKYLVPGIAEMHAHIPRPQPGPEMVKITLMLYLSIGITTIRGMLGHESHLKLRENVQNGSVLGPTIYTSSPSMNGGSVPSKEVADSLVRAHKDAGYDFLKIHPGIQLDVFNAMIATANEMGIGYSGHVPYDVGIRNAIASGYGSVDHVDGFVEGLVPDGQELSAEENGFFGFNSAQVADETLIEELITMTVQHDVWVVPTQTLFDRWGSPVPAEELAAQPEMKYMQKQTIQNWIDSKVDFLNQDYYSDEKHEVFNSLRRKIIKALNDEGKGLLLGSDAPQVFNVPGFSIQHEMKAMVDAGLTPYETLKAGTVNVAEFFGRSGETGIVSENAAADLILLNANPLDDISNMSEIEGVMVRGKWLDRAFIEGELEKIAAANEAE